MRSQQRHAVAQELLAAASLLYALLRPAPASCGDSLRSFVLCDVTTHNGQEEAPCRLADVAWRGEVWVQLGSEPTRNRAEPRLEPCRNRVGTDAPGLRSTRLQAITRYRYPLGACVQKPCVRPLPTSCLRRRCPRRRTGRLCGLAACASWERRRPPPRPHHHHPPGTRQ